MKKYLSVILLVCIIIAGFRIFLYPIMNRGKIDISVNNKTPHNFNIVQVNDQIIKKKVNAMESTHFRYKITSDGIGVNLQLSKDNEVINKEIIEYIETAYYGTVNVFITDNHSGEIEIGVKEHLSY